MKITAIHTFIVDAYRTNWVFVKIQTDEGIQGIGESTLEYKEHAVAGAIKDLERFLLGKDPSRIEDIWHSIYRDAYWRGGPVLMSALSGIEMALWDIKGKQLDVPVYELLGGKVRDAIPCYANGWFAPARRPDEFAAKARDAVAAGFAALKWDPFGSAYRSISRKELDDAIACVTAVKEAVGSSAELLIEGHGRFDVATSVRIAQALEPFGILWFEEPTPPDSLDALAEVKRRSRVPIAAGERLYSRWEAARFLELRCADFIQPDPSHIGGIGELKKVAAMAEAFHIAVCPHNPSGPVANAASLQLAACVPNFQYLETMASDVPWRRDVCPESVRFENGQMTIPTAPGLGVDLDEAAMAAHPYKPHDLRHYRGDLTDIRPSDARSFFSK
jgi:galactonate dehydratase